MDPNKPRFVFQPAKRGRAAATPVDRNRLAAACAGLMFNGKVQKPTDFDGSDGRPAQHQVNNAFGGYNAFGRWAEGYAKWLGQRPNSVDAVADYIAKSGNALPAPKSRPGSGGGEDLLILE